MKNIILMILLFSTLIFANFTRDKGIVFDKNSRLQWQDEYGDNNNSAKFGTWESGVKYCKNLNLEGKGWRLPTRKELIDIVDYSTFENSIDKIFQNTITFFYWTNTSHAKFKSNAWRVSFNSGYSNYSNKQGNSNIRCTRESH